MVGLLRKKLSWTATEGREITVLEQSNSMDGPDGFPSCHMLCVPEEQHSDAKQINDNKKAVRFRSAKTNS